MTMVGCCIFFIFQIFLPATADSSGVRTVSASPPGGGAMDTRLVDTCMVVLSTCIVFYGGPGHVYDVIEHFTMVKNTCIVV